MALPLKELITKAKIRQARLKAIRQLVQDIPANPVGQYYDDPTETAFDKGRGELAAQIRAILNGDPFEDAYRPGHTANGKVKG